MAFTNSADGRTEHSHCEEENEADRRAAPLDKGHHNGAEEVEAERHRDHHMDDVEAGSPPSEAEGEYVGHSRPGHSNPCAWGSVTVHDSGPGGYIHGEQGTFGRIHP